MYIYSVVDLYNTFNLAETIDNFVFEECTCLCFVIVFLVYLSVTID